MIAKFVKFIGDLISTTAHAGEIVKAETATKKLTSHPDIVACVAKGFEKQFPGQEIKAKQLPDGTTQISTTDKTGDYSVDLGKYTVIEANIRALRNPELPDTEALAAMADKIKNGDLSPDELTKLAKEMAETGEAMSEPNVQGKTGTHIGMLDDEKAHTDSQKYQELRAMVKNCVTLQP